MLVPRVSVQVRVSSFPHASPPSLSLFQSLWADRAQEASPWAPPELLHLHYFDLISSSWKKDDNCKSSTKSRKLKY